MDYMSTNDQVFATIDGIPSWQFRICLAERPYIPVPEREVETQHVTGRMGDYFDKYSYLDMPITLHFNYLEEISDYKPFKDEFPFIRKWLEEGIKLQFSDQGDVYYVIKKVSWSGDVVNDIIEYGEFEVTLTLAPFARRVENAPVELPIRSGSVSGVYYNSSAEVSHPKFIIQATGRFVVRINPEKIPTGNSYLYELEVNYPDTNVLTWEVDSFLRTVAYRDSTDQLISVGNYTTKEGGFPMLAPGENAIRIYSYSPNVITGARMYRNMLL